MTTLDGLWETVTQTRTDTSIAVLADALAERGDPRGTFMQLQIAGGTAAHRQAANLLELHREAWLGPFAELAIHGTDAWRNGLLVGFRAYADRTWPVPDHPGWRTIEHLDLTRCGLAAATGVIDQLHIPLRALHGLELGTSARELMGRSSPRKRLEHLHASHSLVAEPCREAGVMQVDTLQCDTDELHLVQSIAPRQIRQALDARNPRNVMHCIERAVKLHDAGFDARFWYADHRGEKLVMNLGTQRSATLTVHDGTLEVGWKTLRLLVANRVSLAVRGPLDEDVARRLSRRCPGWKVAPPRSLPTTGTLRAALGSWQVTAPLLPCNGREIYRDGRRGFAFAFDRDGVYDSFDCGVTLPTLEDWPPR